MIAGPVGREFPVFERKGLKFGVVICADGGYIEPSRILALKGAQVIFSPHFNYIGKQGLLNHFQKVRSDHVARAVENHVYFVRGNNVVVGKDAGLSYDGVGYGDSYIVDPNGYGVEVLYELPREVWGDNIQGALDYAEPVPTDGDDAFIDDTDYPHFRQAKAPAAE